ncbi:MAG: response regulator transcription factor [Verrucomicrobia bacterium]|nr:response regulator transcription factor [Verrucomicrobiota bacterium]
MPKKKILVVDDDESITRLLMLNLHHTGHYVVHVENDGQAALSAARKFEPDLILLDVMMPGMDGGDLAATFQATPQFKDVPIIFLTAAVKHTEASGGRDIGGFPFLAKPVDVDELVTCIEKQFRPKTSAPKPGGK